MNHRQTTTQPKLLTVPNLLSLFRLLLIPLIVWTITWRDDRLWATALLLLSGMTDLADGWIARRFGQISDVGKVLDPIADKLTQTAVLICLVSHHPLMVLPLSLLVFKELIATVLGLWVIHRTGLVNGAEWHGKVSTTLLYIMMGLHLLWAGIPTALSHGLILLCTGMILYSCIRYTLTDLRLITAGKTK